MLWLMGRQLDDVAGKQLQKSLEDSGLTFLIGAQTEALVDDGSGVNKGAICKAIKNKGLLTLALVRKHTKASASCGSCTGLFEQLLMFTAGGACSKAPAKKAMRASPTPATKRRARPSARNTR